MTAPNDLARRVWLVAGVLACALAGACGLLRGAADAAGVVVGSALTLLNFEGLTWVANRAIAGGLVASWSRTAWVGAGGLRLGLLGGLAGLVVTQTGVGVAGLVLSLTLVPVAVVVAGLRAARTA
jgi:hypothetical protein